jgi:hypothetical protein
MITMNLNLPISSHLAACRNILVAGMGGGFDFMCGLPIYFELERQGLRVHLANFSFSDITGLRDGIRLSDTLVGVTSECSRDQAYFPELFAAQWFRDARHQAITIWCFQKTGGQPLLENYERLVAHLDIDAIVLVDGGVDSLMRGDEANQGTVIEDATSLYAVNALTQVPVKFLACIGFGAERDVSHVHVLENIAALTREGAALGSCGLIPGMEVYQDYEDALTHVQAQPVQDPSVINSSIVSAVRGHFGDFHFTEKTRGSRLWISPWMTQYWFFDCTAVARRNLFLPHLDGTKSFRDVLTRVMEVLRSMPRRHDGGIPL